MTLDDTIKQILKPDEVDRPGYCVICGEAMPRGQEMFKFHGFSGVCPKPPLPRLPKLTEIDYRLLARACQRMKEALGNILSSIENHLVTIELIFEDCGNTCSHANCMKARSITLVLENEIKATRAILADVEKIFGEGE